jgi:hypothetical protein
MNEQANIISLEDVKYKSAEKYGNPHMELTDIHGRRTVCEINRQSLGTVLHQVLSLAAQAWQDRPGLALDTAETVMRTFPTQKNLSMQAASPSDVAIRFDLDTIEMVFLIPVPGMKPQH